MTKVGRRLLRTVNRECQQIAYNAQWLGPIGKPVVFQIEVTNRCPMRCDMCPRTHSMTRPLGLMDGRLYRRIVDEAQQTTSKVYLHHFGDSLLHPELGEFIKYAEDRNIRTHLSANPVLLTDARIRSLVDNGLHQLVLSLDGVTEETSAVVRGSAARDVALAEARIHALLGYRHKVRASKPYIILQMVRQKQNAHETLPWLDKWKAVEGIDKVKVKAYMNWNGSDEGVNSLRIASPRSAAVVVCDKPWTSLTILWDGRVVPCCFDYDGIQTLGNVAEESLRAIWEGQRLVELRRCHREDDLGGVPLCRRCTEKEGYPVRRWYYPLNRFFRYKSPMGAEWKPSHQQSD